MRSDLDVVFNIICIFSVFDDYDFIIFKVQKMNECDYEFIYFVKQLRQKINIKYLKLDNLQQKNNILFH